MLTQVVGFVAPCLGLIGMWRAGSKSWHGWAIALASEVPWVLYALLLHQWGLLASCFIWAAVYVRNIWRWRVAVH
jgi:hypothetical protein